MTHLWRCARPGTHVAGFVRDTYGRANGSAVARRGRLLVGAGCANRTHHLGTFQIYAAPLGCCPRRHRAAIVTSSAAPDSGGSRSSGGEPSQGGDATSWPPLLEDWLRSHGGTVHGVELRTVLFPSGAVDRQLRATCHHPAGALLIAVPRMLQLRYDNIEEAAAAAATDPATPSDSAATGPSDREADSLFAVPAADAAALTALYDMMPKGSDTGAAAWQFKHALTVLYHLARGSASPLLPYIVHLPGLAPGVPTPRVAMLMHDDAVDELQYDLLVQDVRNQKYWLRKVSSEVLGRLQPAQSAAFGGRSVDAELFSWAVAVAMSRCFGLRRFRTHTCVPLVDMANHVAPYSASNCEIRTTPAGDVEMYSKREIRAGEELTLTYGTHDNHNLLLSYGFTLQPNPNDAFYFDMDLSTVESLVEGLVAYGGGGGGALAPWQLELLETKLGLRRPSGAAPGEGDGSQGEGSDAGNARGGGGGGDGGGVLRVYLSAATSDPAPIAGAAATADGADGAASETTAAAGSSAAVRQPVDPKLLAALRIATLQDEAWFKILSPLTADQIGGWGNLLARQQEISLMRVLAALATALYTTFPTTIQQDRQLLASASLDVAAASAAATLAPPATPEPSPGPPGQAAAAGRGPGSPAWALHPSRGCAAGGGDPAAAATAAHSRDMAEAVRFRLGLKTTLERCLQALVARAKELDALQTVR